MAKSRKTLNKEAAAIIDKVAAISERHAGLLTAVLRDNASSVEAARAVGVKAHRAEHELSAALLTLVEALGGGALKDWQPDEVKQDEDTPAEPAEEGAETSAGPSKS